MKNDNLILNFADLMQILNSQPDQQEKKIKINVANMARETPKLYMQLNIHIFKVSVPFFFKDQTLNVTCKITDYILAPQPLLLDRMNKMN